MAVLSDELRARAEEIKARYPDQRSALMPLLYLVQSVEGHVSREGMREVAELLGLTTADVEAVATFYTMIRNRPTGRYVLAVCTNVSCALLGAKHLYEGCRELLGPNAGVVAGAEQLAQRPHVGVGQCELDELLCPHVERLPENFVGRSLASNNLQSLAETE